MNYTKGEWKVGNQIILCSESGFEITDNTAKALAVVSNKANANLIAAAPRLYEALKALSFQFAVAVDDVRSKDREVYEQAVKALNKAEGKEVKAE